ncbi:MAG TPA: hypothetical protein VE871_09275 [Longimicrobium sp.]|nr:hypothetical protein [Longimicrobium sp.]
MKRKLELDTLFVQSFSPEPSPAPADHMRLAPSFINVTGCLFTNCRCDQTV